MQKLMVTGAGGYIGSIACSQFLKLGFEIVALDNFSAGYTKPLQYLQKQYGKSAIRYYPIDLRESLDTLFTKESKIDAVIHFAGVCSIDESMRDPYKYFSNNATATYNLLEAMRKYEISRILFSSSCSVYKESTDERARIERDPLGPGNPYGASKQMAEETIKWYSSLFGIQYIILRYFNVCGASEDGSFGDSKEPSRLLVHNAVLGALGLVPFFVTYPEVDTADGSPIRDYVNVLDVVDGHLRGLTYLEKKNKSNIFNLGTGTGYSVLDVIKKVEKYTSVKLPVKKSTTRLGDYVKRVASYNEANKQLGWTPKRSLEESIATSVLWYQHHPQRWI